MKTRDPKMTPPKVEPIRDANMITETRKYRLITPLFGGGVKAGEADPITVIRGASVRGQLRFWWRATRGGQFDGDLDAMRKVENAIWGSVAKKGDKVSGQSEVKVFVREYTEGTVDHPYEVIRNPRNGKPKIQHCRDSIVPPYVAFPLQPKQEEAQIGMETQFVREGIEFTLEISYPNSVEEDVTAALWAWETFGGIGARTRRGFGALQLVEHWINGQQQNVGLPPANQVEKELRKKLKENVLEGKWPKNVPHLAHALRMEIFPKKLSSPIKAWQSLITRFQRFRQQDARVDKRTGKQKNQGLSLWPEANALRSRLKRKLKWPQNVTNPKLIDKFPRAAFGLPILFHLPHDGGDTYTLQGGDLDSKGEKSIERLASRLILKPLACANGKYVGLAAVLVGPATPPTGLQIKEPLPIKKPVEWELEKSEARSEPLNQILHGETDVIEAFLKTLK